MVCQVLIVSENVELRVLYNMLPVDLISPLVYVSVCQTAFVEWLVFSVL